jgi:thiol-disulfide isomerase/thioredoxin
MLSRPLTRFNGTANNDADFGSDDDDLGIYDDGASADRNEYEANGRAGDAMGLAALLPAPMRGRPADEDRAQGRGPLELESPAELDNLMSTDDNAVVYFYKPECPYCIQFAPVYASLAADVHRTNRGSPIASALGMAPVPIVMAKIDGARHRQGINDLRPDFIGPTYGRGYPTVLFKRGADKVGVTWDSSKPREREAIAQLMAQFYDDPTLLPMDAQSLVRTMRNPDPEFVYFGSDNIELVPRFVRPLDPSYVDIEDGLETLALLFNLDPALAARGAFFPVNQADRTDIAIPSIVQVTRDGDGGSAIETTTYANRDAHRWAAGTLADQLGITYPPPSTPAGSEPEIYSGAREAVTPRRSTARRPANVTGGQTSARSRGSRRSVTFAPL